MRKTKKGQLPPWLEKVAPETPGEEPKIGRTPATRSGKGRATKKTKGRKLDLKKARS